jgi:peptide/nickel transport system permease protein
MTTYDASQKVTSDELTSSDNALKQFWRMIPELPPSAMMRVGIAILAFFILMAIFGPLFVHTDPSRIYKGIPLSGPSASHWLGTTNVGQDVLSQLLVGARPTLLIGFITGILSVFISVSLGMLAGYRGGWIDEIISFLSNVFLVIPGLPLVIVIASFAPRGPVTIIFALAFTGWAGGARVIRSQTMALRQRDFVQSARVNGEGIFRILFSEILPNLAAIVVSSFIFSVLGAIMAEAGLEFLGLGDYTIITWGTILFWARSSDRMLDTWWWFLSPGICISLIGTALALINYGLDSVVNPRLRTIPVKKSKIIKPASIQGSGQEDVYEIDKETVLDIKNLSVDYASPTGTVHAVDNVSSLVKRGEIFGFAGESGSGKSTLAFAVARLLKFPASITDGKVIFNLLPNEDDAIITGFLPESADILKMLPSKLRAFRSRKVSIVFQSAMNALNPVLSIYTHISDVLKAHDHSMTEKQRRERAIELVRLVGISPDRLDSFPHQFSGGMRQRAAIALALALNPELIIMDEPTTALDVVVQREILNELKALQAKLGFSVIFITHDLSLLLEISNHLAIMYAGRVVESAEQESLFSHPHHPYTYGLIHSFPDLRGEKKKMLGIPGHPPDLRDLPPGCPFAPRCAFAFEACHRVTPELKPTNLQDNAHAVSCLLYDPAHNSYEPPASVDPAMVSQTQRGRTMTMGPPPG